MRTIVNPRYMYRSMSTDNAAIQCAGVKRLSKLGMVTGAPGMGALDMNSAEDAVVKHTREIVPGMVICGMEVSPGSVVHLQHCQ